MEFELQQLRAIFLALLGLIVVILGMLVAYVILAGRRARQRARGEQAQEDIDDGTWSGWPTPAGPATGQVVVLLRDAPGRALQVEVGGARYRHLAEIVDPGLKRQVVEAALDLVRFTGVLGVESIAPAPVDKTYSWREDLRSEIRAQDQQTSPQPASQDIEAQFLDLLAEIGPAPASEKLTKRRRSSKVARQAQPRSVVDDIEAIIQRRMLLIPALIGRDLHVRQSPEGSVLFVFEGQDYEKLDDIPNMTARQLVKDAIQEWDETT